MTSLGWIGVAALIAGTAAMVIEGIVAGMWTRRISAHARELSQRLEAERGTIQADVERLKRAMEETQVLWQPFARALRYLRHPLTVALIQSVLRRRKAARARA